MNKCAILTNHSIQLNKNPMNINNSSDATAGVTGHYPLLKETNEKKWLLQMRLRSALIKTIVICQHRILKLYQHGKGMTSTIRDQIHERLTI